VSSLLPHLDAEFDTLAPETLKSVGFDVVQLGRISAGVQSKAQKR
jgi:hypothetical protein